MRNSTLFGWQQKNNEFDTVPITSWEENYNNDKVVELETLIDPAAMKRTGILCIVFGEKHRNDAIHILNTSETVLRTNDYVFISFIWKKIPLAKIKEHEKWMKSWNRIAKPSRVKRSQFVCDVQKSINSTNEQNKNGKKVQKIVLWRSFFRQPHVWWFCLVCDSVKI